MQFTRSETLKTQLLTALCIITLICRAYGQYSLGNETYQYWSLGAGAGLYQNKDELLIPTRFDGIGLNVSVAYTADRPRTYQEARFQLDFGAEQNKPGFHGAFLFHELSYDFLYQLPRKTRFYAGARIGGGTHDHFYYGLDDGHLYWLTSYGLQGSMMYILDRKRNKQWQAGAHLYLAGVVSRPEAESYVSNFSNNALWKQVHSGFSFASVADLLQVEGRLQYQFDKANSIRYHVQWYTYPDPSPVTSLTQTITFIRRLGTNKYY